MLTVDDRRCNGHISEVKLLQINGIAFISDRLNLADYLVHPCQGVLGMTLQITGNQHLTNPLIAQGA
ncbi:hypothetical protein D3C78_1775140 [compost metagenome]